MRGARVEEHRGEGRAHVVDGNSRGGWKRRVGGHGVGDELCLGERRGGHPTGREYLHVCCTAVLHSAVEASARLTGRRLLRKLQL